MNRNTADSHWEKLRPGPLRDYLAATILHRGAFIPRHAAFAIACNGLRDGGDTAEIRLAATAPPVLIALPAPPP